LLCSVLAYFQEVTVSYNQGKLDLIIQPRALGRKEGTLRPRNQSWALMGSGQSEQRNRVFQSSKFQWQFIAQGMAPPQRILFPAEKICMVWQQRQSAGAGLCNAGNTCFLNAVLQCLTYTPPLANYLLSREHSQQGFCMMCIMEAHVNKVLHSRAREHFELGREEDAHDFLSCTVNAMQRACLSASSDLDRPSESTTIISQIFGGSLRSRVTCLSCKAVSDSYEAFLDIPVDIKVRALQLCFKTLGAFEHWVLCLVCRCKKNVAASKRFTVHCAPRVLTVCLKRFDCFTGGKVRKVVEYPEYLDLGPYMSQAEGEALHYSLYAVLVHSGASCHGGHYFCYTKASNGLWYRMDDASVQLRCLDTALRQQAYLLFYLLVCSLMLDFCREECGNLKGSMGRGPLLGRIGQVGGYQFPVNTGQVCIRYLDEMLQCKGGETMDQAAQRSCGCPIPGSFKGQVGQGLEKAGPL
uniref:Ubiquitin carboxyl-terminal hydrolase n=1 Tax=Catharus ustulatus TaxID=91951 RepID=A0A8C3UUU1_CATUS